MKFIQKFFFSSLLLLSGLVFAGNPIGYWQLKDDDGKPTMIIRIFPEGQTLSAKVIQYVPNVNARCSECKGENTNKPLNGIVIITDLSPEGDNTWSGGKILNPLTGKVSKVMLSINAAGTELKINSYGFISWFGSTDVWTRRK